MINPYMLVLNMSVGPETRWHSTVSGDVVLADIVCTIIAAGMYS